MRFDPLQCFSASIEILRRMLGVLVGLNSVRDPILFGSIGSERDSVGILEQLTIDNNANWRTE